MAPTRSTASTPTVSLTFSTLVRSLTSGRVSNALTNHETIPVSHNAYTLTLAVLFPSLCIL